MTLDREKALKLIIVTIATLAALAVMSTLVQLIQTVLPFLIVGMGIYAGYRWALSDAPAPSADEVEEQARGIFSRFRRTKKAVETTMKVADVMEDIAPVSKDESPQPRERKHRRRPLAHAPKSDDQPANAAQSDDRAAKAQQMKARLDSLESDKDGAIEFKDSDVVISAQDIEAPDLSRLEEKEKETPKVTNDVLSQIEERRRKLQSGG